MQVRSASWGAVTAGLSTCLVMPGVIRLLRRAAIIDQPNDRSSHSIPTPRGGGVGCVAGAAAGATAVCLRGGRIDWRIAGPSGALAAVGFLDDQLGLTAPVRLGAQLLVGGVAGYSVRTRGSVLLGTLLFPVVVNSVNFMDGINGITGFTCTAWGLVMAQPANLLGIDAVSISGALVLGSAAGFLPWNIPAAQVFLGDVGSYFLGGVIASTALVASRSSTVNPSLGVATVLSPLIPYFADTGFTLLQRFRAGESLFEAHRSHAYQRLAATPGFSHTKVAAMFGLAALATGSLFDIYCKRVAWFARQHDSGGFR